MRRHALFVSSRVHFFRFEKNGNLKLVNSLHVPSSTWFTDINLLD